MPTHHQLSALLHGNPDRVLRLIGLVATARSKRCFEEQRAPDGTPWPQRYPNQGADFLNVAGAISDLASGPRIKSRRYEARPAGRDTGDMMNRLTANVAGGELRVGSNVPYAERFHAGGESRQVIDTAIKRHLSEFLRKQRRGRRRRGEAGKSIEERRLGPLFNVREWTTDSQPRPFVGLTQQDAEDIRAEIMGAADREDGAYRERGEAP